ncbi:uncharacterized protein N7443_002767 [Penicillium atrosanguineum]|uniref:uncharacterized protein n=1 Tax=Penicillium atrosanguineum TaxID=1132637 RepID=UPI002394DBFF|nr:uncharacterized protein N7443_002767 [Penicillium atrosanguineum]KAJ5310306.1 hypothetical protein N7443_002767 [Penicillium atrosanguineum]
MTILSPSLILLTYRAENESFVLDNSSGVHLKIDEYKEYVNTHSDTISHLHSNVLESATEKIQNDFSA